LRLVAQHPVDLVDGSVLKVWHYRVANGERDAPHEHDWAQLDWSPTGVLTVDVGHRAWVVPPAVGFWIPAGCRHAVGATKAADLHHITFYPDAHTRLTMAPFDEPRPVAMNSFMAAVLERLAEPRLTKRERGNLGTVFVEAMTPASDATFELAIPHDERAAAVARYLIDNPHDKRTLEEWGAVVGASRRTLGRLFHHQTGLTFTDWRTRARITSSLTVLSTGVTVSAAARQVGYRDPSAYIAAFRRTLGTTPREFQLVARPVARRTATAPTQRPIR
jgi:AraC-like DNA-binding protein/quercetin dioxygenase-like cupin family protein